MVSYPARKRNAAACRAGKCPSACAEGASEAFGAGKGVKICAERVCSRLPGRKMPFSLRGGCSGGVWGRKRYQILRGTGMQPPAGQKNALQPARKVLRRHLEQEKVSNPARKRNAAACRAGKCPLACAEGAPEAFGAGKGIKSCAEKECSCLPGRKMPFSLRGGCSGGIWSRKGYQNLRGKGMQLPAGQKNALQPARKVLRRYLGQERVSKSARNGNAAACRAGKCP